MKNTENHSSSYVATGATARAIPCKSAEPLMTTDGGKNWLHPDDPAHKLQQAGVMPVKFIEGKTQWIIELARAGLANQFILV